MRKIILVAFAGSALVIVAGAFTIFFIESPNDDA